MLDLRQVQAFVAVVEQQSFTRAAERLHIGQSGLSAQIKKLETRVGYKLFDRTGRSITTTEAGRKLYRAAQQLLSAAENFDRLAGTASTSPVLRLAIAENGVNALAVEILGRLRQAFPETDLELQRVSLLDQHERIDGEHDGVIARPPFAGRTSPDTEQLLLAYDPLVLTVHETHPLAGAESVSEEQVMAVDRLAPAWVPRSWTDEYPVLRPADGVQAADSVRSFRDAIASVSINRVSCVMPASFAATYNLGDVIAIPIAGLEPMQIVLLTSPTADDSMTARLIGALDRNEPLSMPLVPSSV